MAQSWGQGQGEAMHALIRRLFPICRSITGQGLRDTLAILGEYLPEMVVHEIPSGTQCFDWPVPMEWNIREAFIEGPDGGRVVDFADHNLHVASYSTPVDAVVELDELERHLHSLPDQPDAIPYVTSYYRQDWAFCLTHRQRQGLRPGKYRVRVDSTLEPGHLNYGEWFLPGDSASEVFVSTYVCHPSMANNELSGPAVATFLGQWLSQLPHRRYSYRFVFIPETIGSIAYLSRNHDHLRRHVVAAFNLTCCGDERVYSYLPSRCGGTLSDRVVQHVLGHLAPDYIRYSFLDRGSDERQYCAPGVDLPMVSLMRSKYHAYPEYHTSLDDLSLVTPAGLGGTLAAMRRCIEAVEAEDRWKNTVLCEPQMGPRGLYNAVGGRSRGETINMRMNVLAYCDGQHSVMDIADILKRPVWDVAPFVQELAEHGLITQAGTVS